MLLTFWMFKLYLQFFPQWQCEVATIIRFSLVLWVWVDSGSWWWTGMPGWLWFMGSQRARHDWATELNYLYEDVACILDNLLNIPLSHALPFTIQPNSYILFFVCLFVFFFFLRICDHVSFLLLSMFLLVLLLDISSVNNYLFPIHLTSIISLFT